MVVVLILLQSWQKGGVTSHRNCLCTKSWDRLHSAYYAKRMQRRMISYLRSGLRFLELLLLKPLGYLRRAFATLAEKGDQRAWDEIIGHAATFWLPSDNNATTRLLAAFLKRTRPDQRPRTVRLVAPIPLYVGATSVTQILDLWHCALLMDKWAPIVKNTL